MKNKKAKRLVKMDSVADSVVATFSGTFDASKISDPGIVVQKLEQLYTQKRINNPRAGVTNEELLASLGFNVSQTSSARFRKYFRENVTSWEPRKGWCGGYHPINTSNQDTPQLESGNPQVPSDDSTSLTRLETRAIVNSMEEFLNPSQPNLENISPDKVQVVQNLYDRYCLELRTAFQQAVAAVVAA